MPANFSLKPIVVLTIISFVNPVELKQWRQKNNCSQGILATVLGIDVITVSRWERGLQKIPPYLHYALENIEMRGNIIENAIERRADQRIGC